MIVTRPPDRSDQNYVASTWTRSLLSAAVKDAGHIVDKLLDDPRVKLRVACESDRPTQIHGWLTYTEMPKARLVHYCYVRSVQRKHGIARLLMSDAGLADDRPLWFTLRGPDADELLMKFPAVYVPVEGFLS